MSVATKNPFAILDAEDSSRPSSPPAISSKATSQAPTSSTRGAQRSAVGPASRVGKYYPRGGARSAQRDPNQPSAEEPVTENQRKTDGRGRGRGRGGAARGGRGRQFDRHSQTGKTDSDKKMHQGWGGDEGNTELKAEEAAADDAAAEANPESPAEGQDSAAADAAQPEDRPRRDREPEEEDVTLTLDQYFAQRKENSALPKLEGPRRANEGDSNIWKDAVPLAKNEDEEAYFVGKTKSTPKARAKKEDKIFIEIDGHFTRPDRGGRGRGRGDRSRGVRGRGAGRGSPRQNGGTASNLNVDDQTAFPSLA